jgi:hypothetical protein
MLVEEQRESDRALMAACSTSACSRSKELNGRSANRKLPFLGDGA